MSSELSAASKKKIAQLKASARFKRYDKKSQTSELAELTETLLRHQRVEAAWALLERDGLRPGVDDDAFQGLDEAFDNHTIDDDYLMSLTIHDGGVLGAWRLLSLVESEALEIGETNTAELKAVAKNYAKANVEGYSKTWLFAVGKGGRALGFLADFRGYVFELGANGKTKRIAETYLDWLEAVVEAAD